LLRFWAENGGGRKNKANRRGRGPRLGIGDCRLGIRQREIQPSRKRHAPNKPNLPLLATPWAAPGSGHGASTGEPGPGVRDARYEIRDSRYASTVWTECQTKPICAVLGLEMRVREETKPICTRPARGNLFLKVRAGGLESAAWTLTSLWSALRISGWSLECRRHFFRGRIP
jgi:hypothetical protein